MPRKVDVEWKIGAAAFEEAQRESVPPGPDRSSELRTLKRFLLFTFLSALCVFTPFALTASSAQLGVAYELRQIQNEIQKVLDVEVEATILGDRKGWAETVDPEVSSIVQRQWRTFVSDRDRSGYDLTAGQVTPLAETVQVDVWVSPPPRLRPWQPDLYYETRFYRQTDNGWVRSLPEPEFWGANVLLESENLRFEVSERDAEMVSRVADRLDRTLLDLYATLDISLPETDDPLMTIVVAPEPNAGSSAGFRRIVVPSPYFLWPKWVGYEDDDRFADYVVGRLASYAVSRRLSERNSSWISFLHSGLGDWLAGHYGTRLHPWLDQADYVLGTDIDEWWPIELSSLTEFRPFWVGAEETDPYYWVRRQRGAYWLIDYVVEKDGIEALPDFISLFTRYYEWKRFSEAYATTPERFSREWNVFLREALEEKVQSTE